MPAEIDARKCTPPQSRLRPHWFSNSVQVCHVSTTSLAGVIPGSTFELPAGAVTENPSSSDPKNARRTCACTAQKLAVAKMVQRMLVLDELPDPDAADALALALAHTLERSGAGLSRPNRI